MKKVKIHNYIVENMSLNKLKEHGIYLNQMNKLIETPLFQFTFCLQR